jgi:hypothetical protein
MICESDVSNVRKRDEDDRSATTTTTDPSAYVTIRQEEAGTARASRLCRTCRTLGGKTKTAHDRKTIKTKSNVMSTSSIRRVNAQFNIVEETD